MYEKPLFDYLKRNPHIDTVIYRTDNDQAGRDFVKRTGGALLEMGMLVKANFPKGTELQGMDAGAADCRNGVI